MTAQGVIRMAKKSKESAKYKWRDWASQFRHIDAATAAAEIERLQAKARGKLSAAQLLAASTPKSSPLHAAFTWDDTEAAEAHRLEQARALMRGYWKIEEVDGKERCVKGNYSIHDANGESNRSKVYVSIDSAMKDPEMRDEVLRTCLARLNSIRREFAWLTELAAVWKAVDKAAG
jgi:hypothetical protein